MNAPDEKTLIAEAARLRRAAVRLAGKRIACANFGFLVTFLDGSTKPFDEYPRAIDAVIEDAGRPVS